MTYFFFFFNDTATTEIYTLSLHDALPIWTRPLRYVPSDTVGNASRSSRRPLCLAKLAKRKNAEISLHLQWMPRSEEHTSELQSLRHLVCRLLLEKKKIQVCETLSTLLMVY